SPPPRTLARGRMQEQAPCAFQTPSFRFAPAGMSKALSPPRRQGDCTWLLQPIRSFSVSSPRHLFPRPFDKLRARARKGRRARPTRFCPATRGDADPELCRGEAERGNSPHAIALSAAGEPASALLPIENGGALQRPRRSAPVFPHPELVEGAGGERPERKIGISAKPSAGSCRRGI